MTDVQVEPGIVKSCRWDMRYTRGHVPVTLAKAADEIERLRAALAAAQAGGETTAEGMKCLNKYIDVGFAAGIEAAAKYVQELSPLHHQSPTADGIRALQEKMPPLTGDFIKDAQNMIAAGKIELAGALSARVDALLDRPKYEQGFTAGIEACCGKAYDLGAPSGLVAAFRALRPPAQLNELT